MARLPEIDRPSSLVPFGMLVFTPAPASWSFGPANRAVSAALATANVGGWLREETNSAPCRANHTS